MELNKDMIRNLIYSKSERVTLVENDDGTSDAWKYFTKMYVDKNYSGFVFCKVCKQVLLKWKSKDGTSGLLGHSKCCTVSTKSPATSIKQLFAAKVQSGSASIAAEDKSTLADKLASMCGKDIRPFSIVEGAGFRDVASHFISIGARYGNINIDNVMPSARTVSRHANEVALQERKNLADLIAFMGPEMWYAITTDMWTETMTSSSYTTVTTHFVDESWQLCARILATRLMEEQSTAANVQSAVEGVLSEFGILRASNVFVTDNGSNVKAAFSKNRWLPCAGHNLNLVLLHGLQLTNVDGLQEVSCLIDNCKAVVGHVKRSKLQAKLEKTVKQQVSTRWNSVLSMLQSVNEELEELRRLSGANEYNDKKLQRILLDVNDGLLKDVISVLLHFDIATRVLSSDKEPTIHLVLPVKCQLKQNLAQSSDDSQIIIQLKERLSQMLEQYFSIHFMHMLATLLDPSFKDIAPGMTTQQKLKAIDHLKALVAAEVDGACISMQSSTGSEHADETAENTADCSGKPPAAKKLEAEFLKGVISKPRISVNEMECYLANSDIAEDDILRFWQQKSVSWPKLAAVARKFLSISATSTSSERSFSIAGLTISDRRSQLAPRTVDDLLFLHGLSKH